MDKKERVAKWLASVIENGEPYDDFDKMEWEEFAGGEKLADAFRELADQVISTILPEDKPPLLSDDDVLSWMCKQYGDENYILRSHQRDREAQREADIKFYAGS